MHIDIHGTTHIEIRRRKVRGAGCHDHDRIQLVIYTDRGDTLEIVAYSDPDRVTLEADGLEAATANGKEV